jgi:hypothetical protein
MSAGFENEARAAASLLNNIFGHAAAGAATHSLLVSRTGQQ